MGVKVIRVEFAVFMALTIIVLELEIKGKNDAK